MCLQFYFNSDTILNKSFEQLPKASLPFCSFPNRTRSMMSLLFEYCRLRAVVSALRDFKLHQVCVTFNRGQTERNLQRLSKVFQT